MEKSKPQIFLFVSKGYSNSQVPGFLTIPFNYDPEELINFYEENSEEILDIRIKYDELTKRLEGLKKNLQNFLKIKQVKIHNIGNNEELESAILYIKQLIKFFTEKNIKNRIEEIHISKNIDINLKNGVLNLNIFQFNELNLLQILN